MGQYYRYVEPEKQKQATLGEFGVIIFDGKEESGGHYVAKCNGGGINLHINKLGRYKECSKCRLQPDCQETAEVA